MSNRYLVWQHHRGRWTPRCDLTGSPFTSNRKAKAAAEKFAASEQLDPADLTVKPRRRRSACH